MAYGYRRCCTGRKFHAVCTGIAKEHIGFELHLFPHGNHGLGLGTRETDTADGTHFQPEVSVWPELFATWVENL